MLFQDLVFRPIILATPIWLCLLIFTMKFSHLRYLALGVFATTPILACLHTEGEIAVNRYGIVTYVYNVVVDNGSLVCGAINDSEWWFDQDGHIAVHCQGGYFYAFEANGETSWYSNNGGGSFSWNNDPEAWYSGGGGNVGEWTFTWSKDLFC